MIIVSSVALVLLVVATGVFLLIGCNCFTMGKWLSPTYWSFVSVVPRPLLHLWRATLVLTALLVVGEYVSIAGLWNLGTLVLVMSWLIAPLLPIAAALVILTAVWFHVTHPEHPE